MATRPRIDTHDSGKIRGEMEDAAETIGRHARSVEESIDALIGYADELEAELVEAKDALAEMTAERDALQRDIDEAVK